MAFQFIQHETEKPKATTNAAAAAAFPLCNDSDSWKTNLAIKEGEKRERERKRRKAKEGEIEFDFPTFCLFGAKKEPAPRGATRVGQTNRRWLSSTSPRKFFFPRRLARTRTPHARFSPFPLMNRNFELVRDLGKERERANYRRDTPR